MLSSIGGAGAPRQAVVHYLLRADGLVVNGRPDRRWATNLRRDPRASMVVHDADQPLHWVGVKGNALVLRTVKRPSVMQWRWHGGTERIRPIIRTKSG